MKPQVPRTSRVACTLAALVGALLGATSPAHAGNFDSFYLGNEAAIQGGASTATARHGNAIWYNPAGLARLEQSSIDASVTAFSLSFGENVDLDSTLPDSETKRLKNVAFEVVPAALTYARQFSFGGAGFGLFVPEQSTQFLRTRLRAPAVMGDRPRELSVDVYAREQDYYGGPAFGVSVGPYVDLGASLFVAFQNSFDTTALALSLDAAGSSFLTTSHATDDQQTVGLQPVAGLQLHPGGGWELGLVLRLPTLRVYQQSQNVEMTLSASEGSQAEAPTFQDDFDETAGFSGGVLAPLRAHLGVAHELAGGQLALDASYRAPMHDSAAGVDQSAVFNLRLGGYVPASENLTLGGGLFTDRAADRLTENSNGRHINYYGASFGIQLDTLYGVITRKGVALPAPQPLIFRTTVVLSYLLGVGEIERIQLGQGEDGTPQLGPVQQHVVDHQLVLHLGATVLD